MRLLNRELATLPTAVGAAMIGELFAVVGEPPGAELDPGAGAQRARTGRRSTGLSRAAAPGRVERVQHVLVVALVADLGVDRRQAVELEVGTRARADQRPVGKKVELPRTTAVPHS